MERDKRAVPVGERKVPIHNPSNLPPPQLHELEEPVPGNDEPARLARLTEDMAVLKAQNEQLMREQLYLTARIQALHSSPAWRAIEKYRAWLRQLQFSSPLLFYYYEKFAIFTLDCLLARAKAKKVSSTRSAPSLDGLPLSTTQLAARDPGYRRWIAENEPGDSELGEQTAAAQLMKDRPLFSVIVPVHRVASRILRECLESVLRQTYDRWELCIVSGDSDADNRRLLSDFATTEPRIRLKFLERNLGISGNSNEAIHLASGEFLVFLDHDDLMAPTALFELACFLGGKRETDLIYSDHDYVDAETYYRFDPLFKPSWSPDMMFSANYITHLTAIRRSVVEQVGGFASATDGAQDWDLFLRVAERTKHIAHLPKILYHWRVHPNSTALNTDAKSYATKAQLTSLQGHVDRLRLPAEPDVTSEGLLHLRWRRNTSPLCSIIIPSKDNLRLLSQCISSLTKNTNYPSYEIIIVDNNSVQPATRKYYNRISADSNVRVVDLAGPFNYSRANNVGAAQARGELLLFLNNDVEVLSPEWLDELAGWALHPPVGIVGGRLLRPNGAIQHAGVVVGFGGYAGHIFADHPRLTFGLFGSTGWYRNYLAVTGACMMMRRDVFHELGGFDEDFTLCESDVAICLKAWETGYRVVYNPFAELTHYEGQTRQNRCLDEDYVVSYKYYRPYLEAGDPFWNPNLSLWKKEITFRLKDDPPSLGFVLNHLTEIQSSVKAGRGGRAAGVAWE